MRKPAAAHRFSVSIKLALLSWAVTIVTLLIFVAVTVPEQKRTFQEKEEAEGKLQRAKLTSCQLPVYFIGWRGWQDLRAARQKAQGAAFSLADFHDRALKQGAVPLAELGALLQ